MILEASDVVDRLVTTDCPEQQRLIITPEPNLDSLRESGAASVDLRLGTWFLSPRPGRTSLLEVPVKDSAVEHSEERLTKTSYVPFGSQFILHPRSFVLAVTLEWLRLPNDLAGYVVGRSSWGRRGLIIATATGVHPRFTGCLTLELANVGEVPIAIPPGMAICQLFFHTLSKPTSSPEQSLYVGHCRPVLGILEPDDIARRLMGAAVLRSVG